MICVSPTTKKKESKITIWCDIFFGSPLASDVQNRDSPHRHVDPANVRAAPRNRPIQHPLSSSRVWRAARPTPQPQPMTVAGTGPPRLLLALPGCLPILPADAGGLPLPHHAHVTALRHPASRCLAPPPPHARCSGLCRALRWRRAPNRYAHPSLPFVLCETEHPNPGYIFI
jgi:hypothetical protein